MKRRALIGLFGHENPAMELELTNEVRHQSEWPGGGGSPGPQCPGGSRGSGPDTAASQWASYNCSRRPQTANQRTAKQSTGTAADSKYRGLVEDEDEDEDGYDLTDAGGKRQVPKRKLLDYFRSLAASNQDTDQVDLQYVSDILLKGAEPNAHDRYGQTVLHEVSRAWGVDVMRFLLEWGADPHRADGFGVTPLHVAAALDYPQMTRFLLDRKVDMEARTQQAQTPLHYAAKSGAAGCVRLLVAAGAELSSRDYRDRTPLQLAAVMDRSEAAHALLELGADAGVKDSDGQLCITAMIGRMPAVARRALGQFHQKDRMTRKQFYYLNLLELRTPSPTDPEQPSSEPRSPLELIVSKGCLELITHPVVLKLIQTKWNLYGRLGAWLLLILNILFIVAWTTVAISISDTPKPYILPQDWWRVLLLVVALLLLAEEVLREVKEILISRRRLLLWKTWAQGHISSDLLLSHPMWPEERSFLQEQIRQIHQIKWAYFQDLWNIFDWLVYILLAGAVGIHLADVILGSAPFHSSSVRLFAVTIIFLWLRVLKHVRAFKVMGPFIVMLGEVVGDVMRFLFLYVEIFIPYACAFWIIFGGQDAVPSMRTFSTLLYSLYRMTLMDEYQFDAMVTVDSTMAHLLCGTFLFLSSILCMNLLIALLSDTFQRVYDNAQANAVMQQAAIILQVEDTIPFLRRFYDHRHIQVHCAPLAECYDHDLNTDAVQHQQMTSLASTFKESLDEFLEIQKTNSDTPEQNQRQTRNQRHTGQTQETQQNQKQTHQNQKQTQQNPSSSRRSSGSSQDQPGETVLARLQESQTQQNQELQSVRAQLNEIRALLDHLVRTGAGPGGLEEPGTDDVTATPVLIPSSSSS
ncbi:transient receptor potential cation channel subfamily A member 1 isoform X1 [Gadus morhua]|uniref:transient receptor potential cation channel subfamily A member 1 isoform X1 n=1 Tax=Gadus morhua TaxID=8049 RepID=UPI0011B4846C|nr:transient receptor potential cation channel subfamily A member 1-like isoform X1 [Gadus morhua]